MSKNKQKINSKMWFNFIALNITAVGFSELWILSIFNGDSKNEYPWNMFFLMIFISIFIIIFQYPILKLKRNWFYRTLIFYLSFFIFLFFYGSLESILSMDRNNIYESFEDGLGVVFYGHIIGVLFFPSIVLINWSTKEFTLDEKTSSII
jgi:uncharacterized membrane protein